MKTSNSFFRGLKYPFRGILFIFSNPDISKIIMIQFLLNIITFIIVLSSSFYFLIRWLNTVISYKTGLYGYLFYYTSLTLGVGLVIMTSMILSGVLSGLIGGGLNSKLSEMTEEIYRKKAHQHLVGFMEGIVRDIGYELKNTLLIIAAFLALTLINLIPIVGFFVFSILSFIYSLYAISFKYWDYPMELRKFGFKKKLSAVWNSGGLFAGFGLSSLFLFIIPIVNFLVPAICIISGTLIFLDEFEDKEG
jgi:CysZ protein